MEVLSKHRGGLNAIARALLDSESIDGREVTRLVDEAHGEPVHATGAKSVPSFSAEAINESSTESSNGHSLPVAQEIPDPNPEPEPVAVSSTVPGAGGTEEIVQSWPAPAWPPPSAAPGSAPGGSPDPHS